MTSTIVFACLLASTSALISKAPIGTPFGVVDLAATAVTCPMPAKWYATTLDSLADDKVLETDGLVEKSMAEEMAKLKPKAVAAHGMSVGAEVVSHDVSSLDENRPASWSHEASLKPLGENAHTENYLPEDADITAYVDAVKDARLAKQEFAKGQAELMGAMEGLLKVPAADALYLRKAANGANGHNSLIVFYAPWCPHCQTFVLHDEKGDPTNAPLEQLQKKWAYDAQMEKVHIMRADITKVGKVLPAAFKVSGIPTAYFVSSMGEATKFVGDVHDTAALRNFVGSANPSLLQSVAAMASF